MRIRLLILSVAIASSAGFRFVPMASGFQSFPSSFVHRPVLSQILFPVLGGGNFPPAPAARFTSAVGTCLFSGCGTGAGTMTSSYNALTAGGSTLVAAIRSNSDPFLAAPCTGGGNWCVSDTINGNWSLACNAFNASGTGNGVTIFYKGNAAPLSTSNVVTVTVPGNTAGAFYMFEASGVLPSAAVLDGCTGTEGIGGNPISSTFTAAFPGNLLFGWSFISNASAMLGTNFIYTLIIRNTVDMGASAINPVSGATSVQFTTNGGGTWAVVGMGLRTQ